MKEIIHIHDTICFHVYHSIEQWILYRKFNLYMCIDISWTAYPLLIYLFSFFLLNSQMASTKSSFPYHTWIHLSTNMPAAPPPPSFSQVVPLCLCVCWIFVDTSALSTSIQAPIKIFIPRCAEVKYIFCFAFDVGLISFLHHHLLFLGWT